MKQVAVLSGKGGTGKTSLVSALARMSKGPLVLADCDVDAANLALTMPGESTDDKPFFALMKGRVDDAQCIGCEACLAVCRFDALKIENGRALINSLVCEGCRACSLVCGADAISFEKQEAGRIFISKTPFGMLVHAALNAGEGNSGKLVAQVREKARDFAASSGAEMVLIDGPPGIGCPVHATLAGVDLVVAVTEPSPSGAADLERLLKLTDHFRIPTQVVINKFDLSMAITERIEQYVSAHGAEPIGRIPFDVSVPKGMSKVNSPYEQSGFAHHIKAIWQYIEQY